MKAKASMPRAFDQEGWSRSLNVSNPERARPRRLDSHRHSALTAEMGTQGRSDCKEHLDTTRDQHPRTLPVAHSVTDTADSRTAEERYERDESLLVVFLKAVRSFGRRGEGAGQGKTQLGQVSPKRVSIHSDHPLRHGISGAR